MNDNKRYEIKGKKITKQMIAKINEIAKIDGRNRNITPSSDPRIPDLKNYLSS